MILCIREDIRVKARSIGQCRPQLNVRHPLIVQCPPDIVGSSGNRDIMPASEAATVIDNRRQTIQ